MASSAILFLAREPAPLRLPGTRRPRHLAIAYLWWLLLGPLGAHRFYLGRDGSASVMLLGTAFAVWLAADTGSVLGFLLLGAWMLLDAARLPGLARAANRRFVRKGAL